MMTFDEALTAAQTLDLDALLTLPPAAKADLQNALLSRMIELVYEGHPYYSRLMRQLGLKPADITTVDDLVLLPVTTKQQFLADPDAFRLNVPSLPVEMRALWEVIYTTGTSTGVPAPVYSTTFDHLAYMHQARRRRSFIPLSERDIVVSLFPATTFPMGAYNRAVSEAAAYGAALVLAQTGRPPRYFGLHRSLADAAELVVSHRATVLWGVASFVRRLLLHAETHQLDFSSVRMVMVTGEASSVAALEGMRNRLRRLGSTDPLVINRYGSTELGTTMVECRPGSGFHNLAPDQIFLEVVDPDTGARLPDGEYGALAITHLMRRGTVLLRYASGDVAALLRDPCPVCQRSGAERISTDVRRVGNIQKVKGTLVDLDAVRSRLEQIDALEEFQVVLRATDPEAPQAVNELLVRYACADADERSVVDAITAAVLEVGQVRPALRRCQATDIFNPEESPKPRRFIDERVAS